jgi:hypothetical protein
MASFDVVCEVDMHEVTNAVDQVSREIGNRYDFKGSKSSIDLKEATIEIIADSDMKMRAVQDILRQKLSKRGIDLKAVEFKPEQSISGNMLKQEVLVKQGFSKDELKRLNKAVKETKLKVSSQIQGEQLRVTGKKRDDLQSVMSHLKANVSDLAMDFDNFRD